MIIRVIYLVFWKSFTVFNMLTIGASGQIENCVLIDSITKEPVSYASIRAGFFVCYADVDGIFSTTEIPGDTIIISRLGYYTLSIQRSDITPTLFLIPKSYSMGEVVVSVNSESFEIGYHNFKTSGFSYNKRSFKAVHISSPDQQCRIEKVLVHTRKNRKGTEFVIGLFSVNDSGLPGDLLFLKEYRSPTGKNMLEVSVDEANLKMPDDGIFVAIKSNDISDDPNASKDHGLLRFSNELDHSVSYFHSVNQWFENDFKELDHRMTYKIGLELVPF